MHPAVGVRSRCLWLVGPVSCVVVSSGEDVRRFEAFLCGPREHPVVALTCVPGGSGPVLSPERVREVVGPGAGVYYLASDLAVERLRRMVGAKLAVAPGAVRVWWPGVTRHSDPAAHPLVELIDAPDDLEEFARRFDLSRPRVRRELWLTEGARAIAEYELREALSRVADLEAALARNSEELQERGFDERLHMLIAREWRQTLTVEERREFLLRYRLTPGFVSAVEGRPDLSVQRLCWVCAMLASGNLGALRDAPPAADRGSGGVQLERGDGAKGMFCVLAGGPRVRYWMFPDQVVEFVGVES
jgi:hypothetical protein